MASSFVTLKGELWYARTDTPETDPWGNTNYKVTLYPDKESLSNIMELQTQGIKNNLKKDDKGYYITYKRPHEKKMKGKNVELGQPRVLNADGTSLSDFIGNGSKGEVKLEIYEYAFQGRKSKAARLDSIKVNELIPYEGTSTAAPTVASPGW